MRRFSTRLSSHPVPLDMNTLTAHQTLLARAWMLYLWLAYRTFYAQTCPAAALLAAGVLSVRFAPGQSQRQICTVLNFRRKDFLRELKKMKIGMAGV